MWLVVALLLLLLSLLCVAVASGVLQLFCTVLWLPLLYSSSVAMMVVDAVLSRFLLWRTFGRCGPRPSGVGCHYEDTHAQHLARLDKKSARFCSAARVLGREEHSSIIVVPMHGPIDKTQNTKYPT